MRKYCLAILIFASFAMNGIAQTVVAGTNAPQVRITVSPKGKIYDQQGKERDWRLFAFSYDCESKQRLGKGRARFRPEQMCIRQDILENNTLNDKGSGQYTEFTEYLAAELKQSTAKRTKKVGRIQTAAKKPKSGTQPESEQSNELATANKLARERQAEIEELRTQLAAKEKQLAEIQTQRDQARAEFKQFKAQQNTANTQASSDGQVQRFQPWQPAWWNLWGQIEWYPSWRSDLVDWNYSAVFAFWILLGILVIFAVGGAIGKISSRNTNRRTGLKLPKESKASWWRRGGKEKDTNGSTLGLSDTPSSSPFESIISDAMPPEADGDIGVASPARRRRPPSHKPATSS
jgi:hypothetical protein